MENKERIIEVCKIISQDVEQDVKNMEETPFSHQAAAIKAIIDILQKF